MKNVIVTTTTGREFFLSTYDNSGAIEIDGEWHQIMAVKDGRHWAPRPPSAADPFLFGTNYGQKNNHRRQ